MICRAIIDMLYNYLESQQDLGWLFGSEHGKESYFSSLIFIKILRLIEEHFQTPELI
jgi:hypothetical protein